MLKAILADDEPVIIRGLKKLIPWDELGIRIAGEAWTGKGLLELIEKEQPELVITDISMPDGSGIDVIKEIARKGLETKIIFISAYQEFSYAKDALAFGAVDYLVKPVEKGLLLAAVQKAVSLLQEKTNEQTSLGKLAAYEQKDRKTQLEELFDRLTEGDIRLGDAQRQLELLGITFPQALFTAITIELEPLEAGHGSWGEHEKRLVLFAVANLTDELSRKHGEGLVLRKGEHLCVIVNHREDSDMLALGEEMADKVLYFLKTRITVGVGRAAHSLQELKLSYGSSLDALRLSYFMGRGQAIAWSHGEARRLQLQETAAASGLAEIRQLILQALLGKDESVLSATLDKAGAAMEAQAAGSKEAAVTAGYTLLTELAEGLREVGIEYAGLGQDQLPRMHGFPQFGELLQYVRQEIAGMLRQLQAAGTGKDAQQMSMVKEFIEQHYQENITLESMAAMVFMNPYYFSSFFKKHTQQNFKQYVTEVRMKQAVKLLLQSDLMVYEIAERVGYNNARQFSDMFKKRFGKLPQEYKGQKR
ncbi:two-component system, response regulator YesN [Paenibacillus sp. UNCCL117]|uniref:response regulator n=1 Tax=unclassified Paenibacillus TaxID=185978 RepID=UPI00087E1F5D|nr:MULTISPECIES: response regulator [unclassified Paenibacillus]SDD06824.1 two-component system, response regulator YesN [Paenibacillus sp. cl123]SFW31616.1 two-component system, response regulator YesN [Paenibacillus sp. UNCCL117]